MLSKVVLMQFFFPLATWPLNPNELESFAARPKTPTVVEARRRRLSNGDCSVVTDATAGAVADDVQIHDRRHLSAHKGLAKVGSIIELSLLFWFLMGSH